MQFAMSTPLAILIGALVGLTAPASASLPNMYETYSGWGTYYGTPPMAPNSHVHCHLPNMGGGHFGYAGVERTIAVNADQFAGSQVCGTCVEVWGHGRMCPNGVEGPDCGLGQQHNAFERRFLAVVTDELWERGWGDIDVGVHGDGRYPVQWKPVPCPWDKTAVRIVLHNGANRNFLKVQFRYMDSGMKWVKNEGSGEVSNYRFHDNYFVFKDGDNELSGWDNGKLAFRAESNLGTQYCGEIDEQLKGEPYEYMAWPC